MDFSPYIGLALLSVAVLVLLGALWTVTRVLGGISALKSDHIVLTTAVEALDTRITREVKTRAGLASAGKAEEIRSLNEQAAAVLAEPIPLQTRPSPIRMTGRR